MSKKNRVARSRKPKKGNGAKKQVKGQKTVTFKSPSTKMKIKTLVPDPIDAMAVVGAATEDADNLLLGVPGSEDVKGAIVIGHVTQWFTENYIKLTQKQIKKGTKAVRRLRISVGETSMPVGKKLVSHIVLLYIAPTQLDRAHLMAHILNISGLAQAIDDVELQEALASG